MDILRKYKLVLVIVVPIIILVLIKTIIASQFKSDGKKWAMQSLSAYNTITPAKVESLHGDKLIINISGNEGIKGILENISNIPADSIMNENYLKKISNYNGNVILCSNDLSVSARIWMALSQSGVKDLYILSSDPDNEVLKYKFRSDTTARPEF